MCHSTLETREKRPQGAGSILDLQIGNHGGKANWGNLTVVQHAGFSVMLPLFHKLPTCVGASYVNSELFPLPLV